ncbi:hypothetical protein [Microbulbifer hydrolyticus]|uniref:Uncharacterized protein n=1 Tax=Microbulbifer hydrolyticus TaxID=48074 RepID=A0A6P1THS0_9GAMM|nr:hypothetical protein [Microbulbifer hydrolyticus]MBB5213008.1 hypothetical protein [Microbulbifer hydrolyticus]QHQ40372.1 hypothetical protein GTQ55_16260 [Microbulbifer hydrolyticus]
MNTQMPVNTESSAQSALLAAQSKPSQEKQDSTAKTGNGCVNVGLRYPEELEHCFVLGNN